jgi:hypothetical protein
MGVGYSEFLRLVLILGGILLPGNLLRWIRYKTLGDLLAALTNVVLLGAAAWDSWGRDAMAPNRVLLPLVVSISLWSGASILLLLTIAQTQIVARSYYAARLKGKDWFDRALFTAGLVWCGPHPEEIEYSQSARTAAEVTVPRPMRYVLLFSGIGLLLAGLTTNLFVGGNSGLERVCVYLYTVGALCTVGGVVDLFIAAQTRKWRVADSGGPKHCEKCGYDLRGLTEARCPECGHAFPSEWLKDEWPRSQDLGE